MKILLKYTVNWHCRLHTNPRNTYILYSITINIEKGLSILAIFFIILLNIIILLFIIKIFGMHTYLRKLRSKCPDNLSYELIITKFLPLKSIYIIIHFF